MPGKYKSICQLLKAMPKQKGGTDCVVYAMVVVTALLYDTKVQKYKGSLMQSHIQNLIL